MLILVSCSHFLFLRKEYEFYYEQNTFFFFLKPTFWSTWEFTGHVFTDLIINLI
jgi:hypothetical protein